MNARAGRLEQLATESAARFDDAERRYRDRLAAGGTADRREPTRVRRLRAHLEADADAAGAVLGRLLLSAGLDAARPDARNR
ncbi:hypothetical protein [Gordonia neofelifaecis]|uniref:Uncharacterized protein n=1 Tax=Gordonia neofelifaecis NRRL B-59395 TaxID=644548 RepID=F1YFI7_9ACTN|nr:hypothetical protein [Gordonia neofelifaecis]EGD56475.1 hypothetical protein SCNU_02952 [Gordonia neofelifaecis NRRL B-59395]